MLKSILMGVVAGARSITPLAAVSIAAARGELPDDNGAPPLLDHPAVALGLLTLAAGEMAGDKMPTAPDRNSPPGIAARLVTAAVAGAALAPRNRRVAAGAVSAAVAVASSYVTFHLRMAALRRWGQTRTGAIEDVLVLGAAAAIVRA